MSKIQRKKLFFFLPFLLIISLTLSYRAHQKSSYKATAALRIEESFGVEPTDENILFKALANQNLLAATTTDSLKKRLSVNMGASAESMEISLVGSRSKGLTNLVNEVAKVYLAELSLKSQEAKKDLIKKRYPEVKKYKAALEKRLQEAKEKLEDCETRMERFKSEDGKILSLLSSLKTRLAGLESERANLLRVYTTLHPDVVRIDLDIAHLKEEIAEVPPRPRGGFELEKELEESQKLFLALKKEWDDVKSKKVEEIVAPKKVFAIASYAKQAQPLFDVKSRILIVAGGLSLALLVGLIAMTLAALSDTSISNPEELSAYARLPVIGLIPYVKPDGSRLEKRDYATGLLLRYEDKNEFIEPYRLLYTHMQSEIFNGQSDLKSVFITSSNPREGKSITASNLALVMARAGKRVILVDCNLARPSIHKLFGIDPKRPGLTDILNRGSTLDSSIMNITDMVLGDMGMDLALKFKGLDRLSLITSGSSISTAGEILRSDKIDLLISDLKTRFDFLILDGPPIITSADGLILAPKCQAVFLVYSAQYPATPRAYLKSAVRQLTTSHGASFRSGTTLKGMIMTKCI